MKKPHVIYLVADQLRYDMLGHGLTPNIDAIAQTGVSFTHAYCGSPLCVPARGALFTGRYPNTNGSLINPWFLPDAKHGDVHRDIDNLYQMMQRGGWDCMHSGKQHLFTEGGKLEKQMDSPIQWLSTEHTYKQKLKEDGTPLPGGAAFKAYVPEMSQGQHTRVCTYSNAHTGCYAHGLENYFDGYFTDRAIDGMRNRDKSKPLFLSAMFLAPHPPFDVPEPFYSLVKGIELPENIGRWYDYQSPLQMYNLTGVIGTQYAREQWKDSWRVYAGLVALLDSCVGRIVDELKLQGIYDESLLIFTTDHGEMLGSHCLFQKMCMYEESVRAPVFIRFPHGEFGGQVVDSAVSHIDVQPTLCGYLQQPFLSRMDGQSWMPAIQHGQTIDRPVFIQFDGNGARSNFQRCIVDGGYKLIADIFKDEVYFELYQIDKDPGETKNLLFAETVPGVAQPMLDKLVTHMRATGDMVELPSTNLTAFVEQYRGMGAHGDE